MKNYIFFFTLTLIFLIAGAHAAQAQNMGIDYREITPRAAYIPLRNAQSDFWYNSRNASLYQFDRLTRTWGDITHQLNGVTAGYGLKINTATRTGSALTIGIDSSFLQVISANGTLNFPSTAAASSSDLTFEATGAALGDPVCLGVPSVSVVVNSLYTAWVSATNTITVRFTNNHATNAGDPASGIFKVKILK